MRQERPVEAHLLFREANDAVAEAAKRFGEQDVEMHAVCECAKGCGQLLTIARDEYEAARGEGRFVILPGHEVDGIDVVVEDRGHYRVVEKRS